MNIFEEEGCAERGQPVCPIFGACGGCQYQDVPYTEELARKEEVVRRALSDQIKKSPRVFQPIVPSPQKYHYRCRLDLKLLKVRSGDVFVGFAPPGRNRVVPSASCAIAMPAISDFLPELKKQAESRLPVKYRNANLVVKTGDDNRVFWGGIGRRSLVMKPEDYLWTSVAGKKIFYSLDTFFQANLSILPPLIERLKALIPDDPALTFYDFYGGVGFFSVCLADRVGKVVLVEENVHACRVARFNFEYHRMTNYEIMDGRMEDKFSAMMGENGGGKKCVLIDPPRHGLSLDAATRLADAQGLHHILYLSCHPETLGRDLHIFVKKAWEIITVIPFDFFPRTEHVETLVELRRPAGKLI